MRGEQADNNTKASTDNNCHWAGVSRQSPSTYSSWGFAYFMEILV